MSWENIVESKRIRSAYVRQKRALSDLRLKKRCVKCGLFGCCCQLGLDEFL